jgi:hypothetical protein
VQILLWRFSSLHINSRMNGNKCLIRAVLLYTFCKGVKNSYKRQNPCNSHGFRGSTQKQCDAVKARQKCIQQVRLTGDGRTAFPSFKRLEGGSNADAIRRQP